MNVQDCWVNLATHIVDHSAPVRLERKDVFCYHGQRHDAKVWLLAMPSGVIRLNCCWPGHRFVFVFRDGYQQPQGRDETFVAAFLMGLFDPAGN